MDNQKQLLDQAVALCMFWSFRAFSCFGTPTQHVMRLELILEFISELNVATVLTG